MTGDDVSARAGRYPRVRHCISGELGELRQTQHDLWQEWALVRWDDDEGPGMRGDGLAYVALGLLEQL